MAVRRILLYSQHKDLLRKKSEPVQRVDRSVKNLINDLKDTLVANDNGIGLAAPQINQHKRVVVVRLGGDEESPEPGPPTALINPKILEASDQQKDFDGCLSFPGLYGETIRPHRLIISSLDQDANPVDRFFEGFDAVVVHHEIDHLEGVLFIDRIESLDDLYQVIQNENGEMVRVPIGTFEK